MLLQEVCLFYHLPYRLFVHKYTNQPPSGSRVFFRDLSDVVFNDKFIIFCVVVVTLGGFIVFG